MASRGGDRARPRGRARRKPALILLIPSQTSFLSLVRDLTKRMAEMAGFEQGAPDRIALAVDEATTNAIQHAYHGAPDREVELRFDETGAELKVEVADSGDSIDPRLMPRVDLERYASERRRGGLGVHLMGRIMDSVTFRRSARRNVCCLVKRKNAGWSRA